LPRKVPALVRYWEKVDQSAGPDACWPWTGARLADGYGRFWFQGKFVRATRWGYKNMIGSLPDHLHILHRCDNPPCMNPEHWFVGTNADNQADKVAKGRQARGLKQGAHTHPESVHRGTTHRNAKLTEADVRDIRGRYASGGTTMKALAREYRVSFSNIQLIIARGGWKHVA